MRNHLAALEVGAGAKFEIAKRRAGGFNQLYDASIIKETKGYGTTDKILPVGKIKDKNLVKKISANMSNKAQKEVDRATTGEAPVTMDASSKWTWGVDLDENDLEGLVRAGDKGNVLPNSGYDESLQEGNFRGKDSAPESFPVAWSGPTIMGEEPRPLKKSEIPLHFHGFPFRKEGGDDPPIDFVGNLTAADKEQLGRQGAAPRRLSDITLPRTAKPSMEDIAHFPAIPSFYRLSRSEQEAFMLQYSRPLNASAAELEQWFKASWLEFRLTDIASEAYYRLSLKLSENLAKEEFLRKSPFGPALVQNSHSQLASTSAHPLASAMPAIPPIACLGSRDAPIPLMSDTSSESSLHNKGPAAALSANAVPLMSGSSSEVSSEHSDVAERISLIQPNMHAVPLMSDSDDSCPASPINVVPLISDSDSSSGESNVDNAQDTIPLMTDSDESDSAAAISEPNDGDGDDIETDEDGLSDKSASNMSRGDKESDDSDDAPDCSTQASTKPLISDSSDDGSTPPAQYNPEIDDLSAEDPTLMYLHTGPFTGADFQDVDLSESE